jgi:hypothetical protein
MNVAPYAKFLTSVAGLALVYATNKYGADNTWVEVATSVAAALAVYAVPNAPKPAPAPPPAPPAA